ncbi:MAG: hypothetical protein OXG53_16090 [Chloroflexi bacterium]|nr:hypothetical protein [Chloroflexota bacterium]
MRRWPVILLILLNCAASHGLDTYYHAHRNDILSGVWKPDGTQFATWHTNGFDTSVEIWRESDGLRLIVLNHAGVPGIDAFPNALISEVYWSDDEETITTTIHTHNGDSHVRQQLWTADKGELLYSFVVAVANTHLPRLETHRLLNGGDLAAYWTDHRLAYMDIRYGSARLGQELEAVEFGDLTAEPRAYWNGDLTRALFVLHDWKARCPDCPAFYRLMDTDPASDSFGDTLWELPVSRSARGDSWYSEDDLFALHREGKIEAWDLDRSSPRFGRKIMRVEREFEFFHTLLFDDIRQRIIIVEQHNMALIEGAHPDAGPQCVERRCEYRVGMWDIDMISPRTNTRVLSLVHTYPYDGYGSRVVLNESSSQIHVHTVEEVDKEGQSVWERNVFAYDLENGDPEEARDIVQDPRYLPTVYLQPLVDLSHLEDKATRYHPLAIHPAGSKLLVRKYVGEDRIDSKVSTVVIDRRTGEQLLPVT